MSLQVFLWSGPGQAREGKTFYNAFTLNGVEYRIGDCVFLYPEDESFPHYVGRIRTAFVDDTSGYQDPHCIEVKWFERRTNLEPSTKGIEESEREVFELEDTDINPIGCISGKCYIVRADGYEEAFNTMRRNIDLHWFFCRGYFRQSTNSFVAYSPSEMAAQDFPLPPFHAAQPGSPEPRQAANRRAAATHQAAQQQQQQLPQQAQQQHSNPSREPPSHSWEELAGADGAAADEDDAQQLVNSKRKATGRSCAECGATQTPQWREGPNGPKTLCNACGVRYVRNQQRAAGVKRSSGPKNGLGRPQELTPPRALHPARVPSPLGTEQGTRPKGCPSEQLTEDEELQLEGLLSYSPLYSPLELTAQGGGLHTPKRACLDPDQHDLLRDTPPDSGSTPRRPLPPLCSSANAGSTAAAGAGDSAPPTVPRDTCRALQPGRLCLKRSQPLDSCATPSSKAVALDTRQAGSSLSMPLQLQYMTVGYIARACSEAADGARMLPRTCEVPSPKPPGIDFAGLARRASHVCPQLWEVEPFLARVGNGSSQLAAEPMAALVALHAELDDALCCGLAANAAAEAAAEVHAVQRAKAAAAEASLTVAGQALQAYLQHLLVCHGHRHGSSSNSRPLGQGEAAAASNADAAAVSALVAVCSEEAEDDDGGRQPAGAPLPPPRRTADEAAGGALDTSRQMPPSPSDAMVWMMLGPDSMDGSALGASAGLAEAGPVAQIVPAAEQLQHVL